jgi:hypothetical protein
MCLIEVAAKRKRMDKVNPTDKLSDGTLNGPVFQTLCRYDTKSKHVRQKGPLP